MHGTIQFDGHCRVLIWLVMAVLLAASASSAALAADAAPIPPDSAVTKDKVHGLQAAYYNFARIRPPGVPGIDSRDIAADFVGSQKPDAVCPLESKNIDFPPGFEGVITPAGKPVAEFLLDDSDGAEGPMAVPMSTRNVFVFTGFIEVPAAGTYEFRIPADDGAELSIGDVMVHSHFHGGWYGPLHGGYVGKAEFAEPGIYPVKVLFWDKALHSGIEVYSDVNSSGDTRDLGGGKTLTLLPFLTGPAATDQ